MIIQFNTEMDWRANLSKIPIPLSVKNDTLLSHCLESLIDGRRISTEIGSELHRNSDLPGTNRTSADDQAFQIWE